MPTTNYFSTQSWVVPADCQTISSFDCTGGGASGRYGSNSYDDGALHVGSGGYGGGAGARAVTNNIAVTPGETLTIYVGAAGGYSGLYRNSTGTWLCLAYGGSGQSGGSPSVYSSGWTGASGANGTQDDFFNTGNGGPGGNGGGSPAYGGGGAGGARNSNGGNATNYGGGGGGGGGIDYSGQQAQQTTAGGAGYQGIATLAYTPIFPPTVTSLSKTTGQISGGDTVVITGNNFNYSVSQVRFGTSAAFSFTVNSNTQITAVTPAHAQGQVDVTVTNQYTTSAVNASDKFTFLFNNWADDALLAFGPAIHARAGLLLPIRALLSPSTNVGALLSDRQLYISSALSAAAALTQSFTQPKGIFARLTVQQTFGAATAGNKDISAAFSPGIIVRSEASHAQNGKARLSLSIDFDRTVLGHTSIFYNAALLTVGSGVTAKPNLPESIGIQIAISVGLHAHEIPVKFISAALGLQTGLVADATHVLYPYDSFGSQVLYREASGLEKAMIDADQPRITGIPAEIIADTWNPYACPSKLLPYLAWAMGVNFWNPDWSEETKRAWIASQWQFKAWRGTNAAIEMAVDFAGRDVSPYGYSVRSIVTQPQGQYPSPGITHAAQEEWLASLPQVRVYLYAQHGQAYLDEFYINYSYLGTATWSDQTYITPDTSKDRLGKKAVWNVHGQDVSDVLVTNFGNYFQLHMPGQAYEEELYNEQGWPAYSFFTPSDAWKRLVTIAPLTVSPYRIAVGPSLRAIDATPDLIAEPGVAGYDVFVGSNFFPREPAGVFMAPANVGEVFAQALRPIQGFPIYPSFFVPDTSEFRLFYRYPVYDPDDLPTGGTQGTMFMGVGWLGFPPFTAEIDVFMAGNRCSAEFTTSDFLLPNGRYFIPQNNEPTDYVSGAIEAARKLTDLTLLQSKPTPVFSAGKPFIAGRDHFVVGQPQLSA